jgi:hypothetical protein
MQHSLAAGTTQAHLDGTTTGIVVLAIVALLALVAFISVIYWAAREPRPRPLGQSQGLARPSDRDH